MLELTRAGPVAPPIFLPDGPGSALVVTDRFRQLLLRSGLSGLAFQPVVKRHIVRLHWERWDLDAAEPEEYPESGEPEDYIRGKPHSAEAAAQLGDLWELSLDEHARLEPYAGIVAWDGADWFRVKDQPGAYVSENARTWLVASAADWISFKQAITG